MASLHISYSKDCPIVKSALAELNKTAENIEVVLSSRGNVTQDFRFQRKLTKLPSFHTLTGWRRIASVTDMLSKDLTKLLLSVESFLLWRIECRLPSCHKRHSRRVLAVTALGRKRKFTTIYKAPCNSLLSLREVVKRLTQIPARRGFKSQTISPCSQVYLVSSQNIVTLDYKWQHRNEIVVYTFKRRCGILQRTLCAYWKQNYFSVASPCDLDVGLLQPWNSCAWARPAPAIAATRSAVVSVWLKSLLTALKHYLTQIFSFFM